MSKEQNLIEANRKYRIGLDSGLTDKEYDSALLDLPVDHFLRVNSIHEGEEIVPIPLGSLKKLKEEAELFKWINKMKLENILISPKLDGLTVELQYEAGILTGAWKGGGEKGTNILKHVIHMNGVPKIEKSHRSFVVTGEAIMKESCFNKKYSKNYEMARNLAAGILNRIEPDIEKLNDLDFVAFHVSSLNYARMSESLSSIKPDFNVVNFIDCGEMMHNDEIDEKKNVMETLESFSKMEDYKTDGAVIINDLIKEQNLLGYITNSFKPKWGMAWKPETVEGVRTKVISIDWQISKNGYFKPVVNIEPVKIPGCTISKANGINIRNVIKNKIGAGSVIEICRAGDVIPKIIKFIEIGEVTVPPRCPSCNSSLILNDAKVELKHEGLNHLNCRETLIKRTEFFFKSLDVEDLGYKTITKLFDVYELPTIRKTMSMENRHWMLLEGFKDKSASNITEGIKLHSCVLRHDLMHASCLFSPVLGSTKLKDVLKYVSQEQMLECKNEAGKLKLKSKIEKINGFAEISASFFVENIIDYLKFEETLTNDNLITIKSEEVSQDSTISGFNFVFSGFRDKELSERVEKLGAFIRTSISKNTNYLVMKDKTQIKGKAKKSLDLGVKIIDIEELKEMVL